MDAGRIIRESLDMPSVARHYGLKPNRAGFVSCPFHGERTPSLKLYPARWKCFGCGEGGDAITFVMKLLGIDFRAAVAQISHDFGLGISAGRQDTMALARRAAETDRKKRSEEIAAERIRGLLKRRREAWLAIRDNPPMQVPDGDILWPDEWVRAAKIIDYLDYQIDAG